MYSKMPPVTYSTIPAREVSAKQLKECANLFSENYGVWAPGAPGAGKRVRLSESRLEECLLNKDIIDCCRLVTAKVDGVLVGHAFSIRFPFLDQTATWITQLVVDRDYRRMKIASKLCSDSNASRDGPFGLVTSHPYAVRALERAAGRVCNPSRGQEHAADMISKSKIPYMIKREAQFSTQEGCENAIFTGFLVDHTEVNEALQSQKDWMLGELPEGHEFFAFTFPS
jgi:Acetyltransferase (GNAT) family